MRRLRQRWINITIWTVIFGFALGGIIFFTPGGLQIFNTTPTPEEEPAILVNGEEIPASDLELAFQNVLNSQRQLYQQFGLNFDDQLQGASGAYFQLQLRSQAAEQLIRNKLLDQEARKRRISVPRTQVDLRFREEYDSFLGNNQLTEEQLIELLRDPGIRERFRQIFNLRQGTLREFKAKLRAEIEAQLKREKLQDVIVGELEPTDEELLAYLEENKAQYRDRVVPAVVPTEEELRAYFEENRDRYAQDEVRVRHILIRVPQDAPEEEVQSASRKIAEIQARLEAGEEFAELAKEYSQDERTRMVGGDLGWIERGGSPFGPEFEAAAFALEEGEISEPVRTEEGFHLIQLLEKRTTDFEDVKDRVKDDYVNEKKDELFEKWLAEAKEKGEFPELPEIRARHILIRLSQDASEEEVQAAYAKIEEIQQKLAAGEDFAALAEEYSDDPGSKARGGDLGWFGYGRMVPEFEAAAFALDVDEISEPVRTQFGLHLIQVLEKRTSDALKNEIKTAYIQQERSRRFEEWVQEAMAQAEIEIKDPLLAAYRVEQKAQEAEDPDEKLRLLDEAIAAYERAQMEFVEDPYLGYYKSRLYQEKLKLLEEKLAALGEGEEADEAARQQLEAQIAETREKAVQSFLESEYDARDAFLFERMIELAPENPELRYAYARFLWERQGDPAGAYKQLEELLVLRPDHWQGHLFAADVQMSEERQDFLSAVEHLQKALERIPEGRRERNQARVRLAQAYLELARLGDEEAREENLQKAQALLTELLSELSEADRLLVEVYATLGDVYLEQGDYSRAQEAYREAVQRSNAVAYELKLGKAYLADGKLEEAQRAFENVLDRDPGSIEALTGLGDVYYAQGDTEKALESYREALDRGRDFETRREAAQKILEIDPDDLDTRFKLAYLYTQERVLSSAIEQYKAILERDPESWKAYQGLGEVYSLRQEYELAKDSFRSAIRLDPPLEDKIALYEQLIEAEQALAGPDQPLGPDGREALLAIAELYAEQGRTTKALDYLRRLQEEYPDFQPERVQQLLDELRGGSSESEAETEAETGTETETENEPNSEEE